MKIAGCLDKKVNLILRKLYIQMDHLSTKGMSKVYENLRITLHIVRKLIKSSNDGEGKSIHFCILLKAGIGPLDLHFTPGQQG